LQWLPSFQMRCQCRFRLGGTLLAITAAAMARDGDTRLKTVSLFASQVDFHEAGELRLFINESQLALVEDMMWMRGYLQSAQMAGAFHILRSNDLIWSRMIKNYFMGERERPIDIMLWSEDTTRMPYRMHAEYLRKLYLENQFAEGRLNVDGRPVVVRDVDVPMFVVGTEWDHVAPWRSVFKIHLEVENEITFVLTTGGHNAGVVSEPSHAGRSYRIASRTARAPYVDPDTWAETAHPVEGSWWMAWSHWLAAYNPEMAPPPALGDTEKGYPPLDDAPGTYVHG
jgi:polyhydroxyalkanoate synthase